MQHDDLLTVEEVARELRLSTKTIRRMIQDGRLIAIDTGKEYRIQRSELEDFKRRHRTDRKLPPSTDSAFAQ